MGTFEKLVALLDEHQVAWRLVEHEPIGQTDLISAIRGNALQQAAKAMVLQVTMPDSTEPRWLLAIVTGDSKINFKATARAIGGKKASFAPPEIAEQLTGCVMGAVPPFSFNDRLMLLVDERITGVGTLWFNAGELDKSISLSVEDYFHVVGNACRAEIAAAQAISA